MVATVPVIVVLLMLASIWGGFRWRMRAPVPIPLAAPAAAREKKEVLHDLQDKGKQAIREKAKQTVETIENRWLKRGQLPEPSP